VTILCQKWDLISSKCNWYVLFENVLTLAWWKLREVETCSCIDIIKILCSTVLLILYHLYWVAWFRNACYKILAAVGLCASQVRRECFEWFFRTCILRQARGFLPFFLVNNQLSVILFLLLLVVCGSFPASRLSALVLKTLMERSRKWNDYMQLADCFSQDPECHSSTTHGRAPCSHFETLPKTFHRLSSWNAFFFYSFLVFCIFGLGYVALR